MTKMSISQAEESALLDMLSREKAIELLPVSFYVIIMMALGLCGNVMVCLFYSQKQRATPTTRLIVVVAVIDTIICILMPKNVVDLSLSYKFTSSALCKLMVYVNHMTAISSSMVLIAVASFRFRAVCKPFSSQFSLHYANIAVIIAITFSLLASIPVLFTHESVAINVTVSSHQTVSGYDCNTSTKSSLKAANLFVNVFHFFIFIASTIVFVVLYGKMGFVIFAHYRKKRYMYATTGSSVFPTSNVTSKSEVNSIHSIDDRDHNTCACSSETGQYRACDICSVNAMIDKADGTADRGENENVICDDQPADSNNRCESDDAGDETATVSISVNVNTDKTRNAKSTKITFETDVKDEADSKTNTKSDADTLEAHRLFEVAAKQTAMLFIITVIFNLSFLPYLAMNISRTLSRNKDGDADFTNWIQFCSNSYLINSAANPFVYGLFNTEFRYFMKKRLSHCFFR